MIPLRIIGGGLAGLSLGIALRHRKVPVELHEAKSFPRHKVCGEFIAGIDQATLRKLGIAILLKDAGLLHRTAWYYRGRLNRRERIPRPALSISRYTLDGRMAGKFEELGGVLHTRSRIRNTEIGEGVVWTSGRRASPTPWLGLKVHSLDYPLESDLEIHLGEFAYAGASEVDGGRVNICGLFRKRPRIREKKDRVLLAYLKACGMDSLAHRLSESEIDPESVSGVAGIDFSPPRQPGDKLRLGDLFAVIPPFTGNGMSMAFEAAAIALDPLTEFAFGHGPWRNAVRVINDRVQRRFRLRLTASRLLHPLLYHPSLQPILVSLSRSRVLPFRFLFNILH